MPLPTYADSRCPSCRETATEKPGEVRETYVDKDMVTVSQACQRGSVSRQEGAETTDEDTLPIHPTSARHPQRGDEIVHSQLKNWGLGSFAAILSQL